MAGCSFYIIGEVCYWKIIKIRCVFILLGNFAIRDLLQEREIDNWGIENVRAHIFVYDLKKFLK